MVDDQRPLHSAGIVIDDVIYEDVAAGDVIHGKAAVGDLLAHVAKAIPTFKVTLQTSVMTEQMAAAEYVISSTQSGDLPYLAATGKAFSIRASSVFVVSAGLIQRESRYYDMVQFLTQLGGLDAATMSQLGTPPAQPGG